MGLQQSKNELKISTKDFFNIKLFKEQLVFFEDIDYSERVEYLDTSYTNEEIKEGLKKTSTKIKLPRI